MDLGLNGKVAVVTGASRGIGLAIAKGLAAEGADLAICARGEDALKGAADELRGMGAKVLAVAADLADGEGASQFMTAVAAEYPDGVDAVVCNVGGNRRKPFEETTDEDWMDIIQLNVFSAFRVARGAIPMLRKRGKGSIVFISSVFGREKGGPGLSIYNTTKSSMISAAGIMALELAPEGIRVNSVAPGSIQFPGGSWDRRVKADPEGMKKFIAANLPLGRFGKAEEVADLVTYLASERSSLITGACIAVDGAQGRALV